MYNQNYIKEADGLLNAYLSDLHILYTKIHNFHWNVVGEGFFTLHAKLEEIYNALANEIDEVAERNIMIGGRPLASLKDYLSNSSIKEVPSVEIGAKDLIKIVVSDFEAMLALTLKIHKVASENDDAITASMIENSIANYEKNIWMMKVYLK